VFSLVFILDWFYIRRDIDVGGHRGDLGRADLAASFLLSTSTSPQDTLPSFLVMSTPSEEPKPMVSTPENGSAAEGSKKKPAVVICIGQSALFRYVVA
jgi:hypothetical protein